MSKDENTPAEAVNKPEETVETPQEVKQESPAEPKPEEKTIGESLESKEAPKEKQTVGLDKYLDLKKDLKKAKNDLKEALEKNSTPKEVSKDIDAIAKEHNVDPEFLEKLASEIEAKASEKIDEKLRPLTEREQAAKQEKMFQERLADTLKDMPEYKDVINVDVVRQLAFNPANANKTFKGLLEETYGNFVGSEKKSIETVTPDTREAPQSLDVDRARTDTAYFKEVMADPELKKQYNEEMLKKQF